MLQQSIRTNLPIRFVNYCHGNRVRFLRRNIVPLFPARIVRSYIALCKWNNNHHRNSLLLTLRLISYTTTNDSATSGHRGPKVAHIVGGTIGGIVGLVVVAVLFLLCRRRRRAVSNPSITKKLENEREFATAKSQTAIRNTGDPDRQLDDHTLPIIQRISGFDNVLSLLAAVQGANASDVRSISQPSGGKTPTPSAVYNPSDAGRQESVLSTTGGEPPFRSIPSHASQTQMIPKSPRERPLSAATYENASPCAMLETSSNTGGRDGPLLSTYTTESYVTASESIFHPETALVPTPIVHQLNEWAKTSKVVFGIDIGTSHSVSLLLLNVLSTSFFTLELGNLVCVPPIAERTCSGKRIFVAWTGKRPQQCANGDGDLLRQKR